MTQSNDVKRVRLGDYIEECDKRNDNNRFGVDSVRGISIKKTIIDTKADMTGVSLHNYKLFQPHHFCFVTITSRNGEKITLALNDTDETYIVSSSYVVFSIKDEKLLIPEYLFMIFNRSEFDRYARFNSWGSAREAFSFASMQDVQIPLPSIEQQREIVDTWQRIRKIKEENETIAAPLLQLCQSYIQDLKHKYPMVELGGYIEERDKRNDKNQFGVESVRGVSITKTIIDTKADMTGVALHNYKLFQPRDFCYVPITSRNGEKITLALNRTNETYIVSTSYIVFDIKETKHLLPEYLYLLFSRPEFDRYSRFNSWGSAREAFSWDEMCRVKIPLPPIEIQQAVVDIYRCANEAKQIAKEADRLSRDICPALMQHVIHENQ